jgi:hypothetical protein
MKITEEKRLAVTLTPEEAKDIFEFIGKTNVSARIQIMLNNGLDSKRAKEVSEHLLDMYIEYSHAGGDL